MTVAACKKCGVTKPLEDFPRREREGKRRTAACKACRAIYMRDWCQRNPEARKKAGVRARARHERNPVERFAIKLRLRFGISVEEYRAMEASQGYKCAICKQPENSVDRRTGKVRGLAVDHCHETGKVRGLLCGNCNLSLGMMRENVGALSHMISYIAKHSTPERIAA